MSMLKKVSLFSACCTSVGMPLLALTSEADMAPIARAALAGSLVFFAVCTTGVLHYVVKTYVDRMHTIESDDGAVRMQVSASCRGGGRPNIPFGP